MVRLLRLVVAGLALSLAPQAQAQSNYPSFWGTVTIVVPHAAGGYTSDRARLLADELGKQLGTTIRVENRPQGLSSVATARPDGYTLALAGTEALTTRPQSGLTPDRFDFICGVYDDPLLTMVAFNSPHQTYDEFVAWARNRAEPIRYGITLPNSERHRASIDQWAHHGIPAEAVPFPNIDWPAIVAALDRGEISMLNGFPATTIRHRVRPLVALSDTRVPGFETVPSARELGLPIRASVWGGLIAPKGLPTDIRRKLESACMAATHAASYTERAAKAMSPQAWRSAEDFQRLAVSEYARYQGTKVGGSGTATVPQGGGRTQDAASTLVDTSFPERSITLVFPYAGGDNMARTLAEQLSSELRVKVNVERIVGGDGAKAMSQVAKATPDGHTLSWTSGLALSLVPNRGAGADYSPERFDYICGTYEAPLLTFVAENSPHRTFQEFIAWAVANPGKLKYGSTNSTGERYLSAARLWTHHGVDAVHVAYKNSAEMLAALGRGEIVAFNDTPDIANQQQVRPLLALSEDWVPGFGDLPTAKELGIPVRGQVWTGLIAPKGLPTPVRSRLEAACKAATATPAFTAQANSGGRPLTWRNGEDLRRHALNDFARAKEAVAAAPSTPQAATATGTTRSDFPSAWGVLSLFSSGGGTDILAPALVEGLSRHLRSRVEWAKGAWSGVATAAPDGYNLAFATVGAFSIWPATGNARYSPDQFDYICGTYEEPLVTMVAGNSPHKTYAELVAWAKANPGKLKFGSTGVASSLYMAGVQEWLHHGVEATHVAYKSGADLLKALQVGEISVFSDVAGTAVAYKLRPLLALADQRAPRLKDVPSAAELGVPARASAWGGVVAPRGLPGDVRATLESACKATIATPAFMDQARKQGLSVVWRSAQDFQRLAIADFERYRDVLASYERRPRELLRAEGEAAAATTLADADPVLLTPNTTASVSQASAATMVAEPSATRPAATISSSATSPAFPSRWGRISMVATGGAINSIAPTLAAELSRQLRSPVDWAPGTLSTVKPAAPDGYTIALTTSGALALMPPLQRADYLAEHFDFICMTHDEPLLVMVAANSPHKTYADLVSWAKANPDKVKYGSTGIASLQNLGALQQWAQHGVEATHVLFKSRAEMVKALKNGDIATFSDVGWTATTEKLRPLLSLSEQRAPGFATVPSAGEAGMPARAHAWGGLVAPKGLPTQVRATLEGACKAATATALFADAAAKHGLPRAWGDGQKFERVAMTEVARFEKLLAKYDAASAPFGPTASSIVLPEGSRPTVAAATTAAAAPSPAQNISPIQPAPASATPVSAPPSPAPAPVAVPTATPAPPVASPTPAPPSPAPSLTAPPPPPVVAQASPPPAPAATQPAPVVAAALPTSPPRVDPSAPKRRALVIGNNKYQNVQALANAAEDATSIAASLREVGYQVTLRLDLTEREMKAALRTFRSQLQGGDEALFFFAGHGVQLGTANYLLPVDIAGESEAQVKDDAIPLQRVLDDIAEQKARFTLAIIDACRDNPFKSRGRAIGERGLGPTTAATGQMIIFSAGAGQRALDNLGPGDKSRNGLFTRVLLREMQKPGISVDRLVRSVRTEVVNLAKSIGHEQVPAIYDQVIGDFYFR